MDFFIYYLLFFPSSNTHLCNSISIIFGLFQHLIYMQHPFLNKLHWNLYFCSTYYATGPIDLKIALQKNTVNRSRTSFMALAQNGCDQAILWCRMAKLIQTLGKMLLQFISSLERVENEIGSYSNWGWENVGRRRFRRHLYRVSQKKSTQAYWVAFKNIMT